MAFIVVLCTIPSFHYTGYYSNITDYRIGGYMDVIKTDNTQVIINLEKRVSELEAILIDTYDSFFIDMWRIKSAIPELKERGNE